MARDSKKKRRDAHRAAGHVPPLNGQAPKLDAKLAKVVAKRVKKLRVQLADAARAEQKKVRALDKAHRRRQLIQAAIDELSMEVAPAAARSSQPAAPVPPPAAETAAPAPSRSRKASPPKS